MILVLIGAIFLLHNFGYVQFHWYNIWRLWPVFLVVGGVNLVFANNKSAWATILKISVVVGAFALILFGNFDRGHSWWWPRGHYSYHSDNNNDMDDNDDNDDMDDNGKLTKLSGTSEFKQPFDASVRLARLNISGGATTYRLSDTTNDLFKANTREAHGRYQYTGHKEDSVFVMDFSMKNNKGWNWNSNDESNRADIMLNTKPEWDITVETGATDLNFDLSKYKLRSMTIKGGAAQFVVKVGQPLANTNITVSTGASDVTIDVPRDAACHIESASGLSSNTYDGFTKNNDGNYETPGFSAAKNKIFVHISGGISDFKVRRY